MISDSSLGFTSFRSMEGWSVFHTYNFHPFLFVCTDNYDWKKCLRFSIYGGLVVAPTLYCWIKIASTIWPKTSLRTAAYKVLLLGQLTRIQQYVSWLGTSDSIVPSERR